MQKPLAGKRVLVTRARDQAEELISRLREVGADVVHIPTIEIVAPDSWEACDAAISNLAKYDWLVFSSTNGVQIFLSRVSERTNVSSLKSKQIAAVGKKTEQALRIAGLQVDLIPEEYTAEGLVKAFETKDVTGKTFILPQAQKGRQILPNNLRAMGARVDVVPVYKNQIPPKEALAPLQNGRSWDVLTFTSPSTFSNLISLLGLKRFKEGVARGSQVAAIGSVTAQAIGDAGFSVDILPEKATVESLVSAIINRYS